MQYRAHVVDLEKFPDELREAIHPWAEHWNAFVNVVAKDMASMNADLDSITGYTVAEKRRSRQLFTGVRNIHGFIVGHKLTVTTTGLWVIMLLFILRLCGVPVWLLWPYVADIIKTSILHL